MFKMSIEFRGVKIWEVVLALKNINAKFNDDHEAKGDEQLR